jgi:hypothetical protein
MRATSLVPFVLGLIVLGACGPGGDDGDGACADIVVGELVITEVFGDHAPSAGGSGADEGKEWFEIYNATGAAIDLEGLSIVHSRPDGSRENIHRMASVTVDAGGYLVLGNVLPEFVEGHLDYGYADELGDIFNTDGGRIAITCGSEVIDEILYDVIEAGVSTGFDGGAPPDYTANDDLGLWCATPEEVGYDFEPDNFGTPGEQNFDCAGGMPGMCDDGGTLRAIVSPVAGDLVLTEVHPNPSGDDALEEWFEAYTNAAFDLNGVQLDRAGDTSAADVLTSNTCLEVAAGSYLVFGKTAEAAMNGMLPRVDGLFDFSLVDSGDIQVLDSAGTLLDAITWTNAAADAARALDPDFMEAGANDAQNVWCDATTAWAGADLGTPGAANGECTILPPAGMCMDGASARPIVAPTLGQLVITEFHPNPSGDDTKQEWFEVRATAPVDLNESKLDRLGDASMPVQILKTDCIRLDAGEYALFARSDVTGDNGGLPAVDATFTFSLVDLNGDIRVLDPTDGLVDAVTWLDAAANASRQLDPDITDATGNDTLTNWCDSNTSYNGGADQGTPKLANTVQCP